MCAAVGPPVEVREKQRCLHRSLRSPVEDDPTAAPLLATPRWTEEFLPILVPAPAASRRSAAGCKDVADGIYVESI
eukprot:7763099-Pyramimonas_sp.AAC.1